MRLSELIEKSVGLPAATSKGKFPCKALICLLHSLATLMSLQPTSHFAYEPPYSVSNASWPTSFSIETLYTSIGGTTVKKFH
jgi:hypothetical protein